MPTYLPSGIRDELGALQFSNKSADDLAALDWEQRSLDDIGRIAPARAFSTPDAPVYEAPGQIQLSGPRRPAQPEQAPDWRPLNAQIAEQARQMNQQTTGGQAAPGTDPTTMSDRSQAAAAPAAASGVPQAMPSGGMSDEAWARREALRLGIDPQKAVDVGNTEGGFTQPGRQNMQGAPAYSSYQLYIGGPNNPGLGDEALAAGIDPRDPAQSKRAITYALEHAARNGWGAFQGAAANGIGNWDGIGGRPASSPTAAAPSAAAPSSSPAADSSRSAAGGWEVDQAALDDPDKWSLCGPVAAVMAATRRGGQWTVAQAKKIATESGLWNVNQGMGGLQTEVSLLNKLGVAAQTGAADLQHLTSDALAGNTPIISTVKHYFILKGYDPETGRFDTTTSGSVLPGGSRWLTLDQIEKLGDGIQGAAYIDNPSSPISSAVAGASDAYKLADTQTAPATGGLSPGDQKRQKMGLSGPEQMPGTISGPSDNATDPTMPSDYGSSLRTPGPLPIERQPDHVNDVNTEIRDRLNQQMYRQPLQATSGPDSTTGQEYDPRDADQGAHEWIPQRSSPSSLSPDVTSMPSDSEPSAGATTTTEAASQSQSSTPTNSFIAPTSTSPANDPGGAQQPAPFTPPPGLQAVYDAAGNFKHWIQAGAEAAKRAGTGLYEAAQDPQNAIDTAGAAGQAAASAGMEAATAPADLTTALPSARGLKIVQDAINAGGTEVGRRVGRAMGLTDETLFSVFGIPVSGEDIAGFAGATVLDPMNYIGAGEARTAAHGAEETARGIGSRIRGALDGGAERVAAADAPFTATQAAATGNQRPVLTTEAEAIVNYLAGRYPNLDNPDIVNAIAGQPVDRARRLLRSSWVGSGNRGSVNDFHAAVDEAMVVGEREARGRVHDPAIERAGYGKRQGGGHADLSGLAETSDQLHNTDILSQERQPIPTARDDAPRGGSISRNAVPGGWATVDAGPGLAERAAQINLPPRIAAGRAIGAVTGATAGAASAPDDATWDERTARALAGGSLGFMAGGHIAAQGTMGAARLIDSLIARGKLNPEILLDHPEPVTRIKALFGLAAEGLPDNAPVRVPGMAQFIARLHPDQAAELGPLLSGQATAGEVRQIVQRSLGQRFGQTVSEIVTEAVTGMGARGQRAAETRADTATIRGLPDRLQGVQDARPQSAMTTVPTHFGRATETTDPEITGMVGQVARDLGIEPPRVFVAPSNEVNAAVMSGPKVKPIMILTKGLGDANLTPEEMRALLTHELSHAAENQSGAATFGASPNYRPPTPAQVQRAAQQGERRGQALNQTVKAPPSAVPIRVRAATQGTDDRAALRWAEDMLTDTAGTPRLRENDPARPSTQSRVNAGSVANERIDTELAPAVQDAATAGLQNDLPRFLEDIHHRDVLNGFYDRGHQALMDRRQPAIDAAKARGVAPAVIQRMEAKAAADADAAGTATMRQRQGSNAEHAYEATDARLQEQEQRLTADGRWQQLQDAAQAIWDHNAATRQRLVDSGNLDPQVAADLAAKYPHYVPTVPISHLTEGAGPVASSSTTVSRGTKPSISALEDVGTSGERLNPIVASRNSTVSAERDIQRNNVARAFARMMDDATLANPTATATSPATHRTFLGGGQDVHYREMGDLVTLNVPKAVADGLEAAANMGVSANGVTAMLKRVTGVVTSTLTAARASFVPVNVLRDASDYQTRTMVREGNNPTRLPAILGTWADEAGKAALDILAAQRNGRTAIGAATGFGAGALQGDENTPLSTRLVHGSEGAAAGALLLGANKVQTTGKAAEYLARGGGSGGAQGSLRAGQRWYRDVLRDGGAPLKSPADALRYLGDWAHDVASLQGVKGINERAETISRTAAMRRAEAQGIRGAVTTQYTTPGGNTIRSTRQNQRIGNMDPIEAMIAGRDSSYDADRAGTVTRAWNGFIPFLNATVQGGAQFSRMFANQSPAGRAATVGAIGATLGPVMLATEYYNRSDPTRAQAYDDVPQYVKDSGIVLMMPWAGSDTRGSKPNYLWQPTEVLTPFVVGMRAAMQHADAVVPGMQPSAGRSDANPNSVAPQALSALNEALSVFYPVRGDSAASLGSTFVPPVAKQAIELSQNKDMFRGGTISSPSQDERASGFAHTVAGAANSAGRALGNQTLQNVTPSHVDYLARQVPAYGDIVTGASDMVKPSPYKQAEQGRIANEPFVGGIASRFVRDTGGANLERAQGQTLNQQVQAILQSARMRPSEADLTVPADYKGANLTRDEMVRWQQQANIEIQSGITDALDSKQWDDPMTRSQAVKDAISKAKERAAKDALGLTPRDIKDRIEQQSILQRQAVGAR